MKKYYFTFLFTIFSFVTFSKEKLRGNKGMEAGCIPFNWYQNSDANGAVKIKFWIC